MGQFDSVHKFVMTCGVQKSFNFGLYDAKAETYACVLVALTQNELGFGFVENALLFKLLCSYNLRCVYLNGDCCIGVVQSVHSF